jgi:hypothetical protein
MPTQSLRKPIATGGLSRRTDLHHTNFVKIDMARTLLQLGESA